MCNLLEETKFLPIPMGRTHLGLVQLQMVRVGSHSSWLQAQVDRVRP